MTFDEQVLELAEKSADAAEAFVHTSSATPVEFEANKLKSIETKVSRSVSLRLIKDGRIGTTSTSRDDDPEAVVASALESSVYGAEARFEFPPLGERTKVDVYDGETPTIPVESMAEAGKQLIARLLEYNPELLIDVSIGKDDEEIRIARYGAAESYRRTGFGVSVSANLIRGTDMLDVYSFNVSCSPDLDTDSLFDEIREKLELARDAGAVESGSIPVVLSPIAFMLTVGPALRMGFNGKMVEQGASPLVGKLGEEVFDPALTIHDDATLQQRPSSSPFDDEGVPTRSVPLVENGIVSEFLYDLQTAGRMGTQSTGNGYRGGGSPSPSSTAAIVDAGEGSLQDLIGNVENGLFVDYILGGGQANVLRGDFGGNVQLGFKIENGRLAGRVKDTLIAGNAYEVLAKIRQIGGERRWVGAGLYCPPMALDGITVSTKA